MVKIHLADDTLYISGELKTDFIKSVWEKVMPILNKYRAALLEIDLSNISEIDSAGVALLDEIRASTQAEVNLIQVPDKIQQTIATFTTGVDTPEKKSSRINLFESMGDSLIKLFKNFVDLLYLMADIFYWSIFGLFHKKGQREGSFVQQSVLIGVNAVQIVTLISFLIGLILALQSAAQLRQFGANIFIADLIGIAMLKEMGPIMTAIVVAGRSGSAIASEIATMVVTEEVDALRTMALNPIRFVVVPKFHAMTITLPLLTVLSDLVGILGGLIIGITYLQLSAAAFMNELLTVLIFRDVITGLVKSIVFAWIIVIVGCYYGLKVAGGAEGVGKATTASVVASIFFVIIADSILGLVFYFGRPLY